MAKSDTAVGHNPELPSYDICWSPEIGLAHLVARQMEGDQSDVPSRRCIQELLNNCVRRRRFTRDDAALIRSSALEFANGLGRDPKAHEWLDPLICLIRVLETDSPDLKRSIALKNYVAKALLNLKTFVTEWRQVIGNKLFFRGNTSSDLAGELEKHLHEAEVHAGQLIVELQSCDCADKIRECLDHLRHEFRESDRCCCVLLCELRGQIYRDVCIAEAQARLIEVAYYARFAGRLCFEINGVPQSIDWEINALQATVARLIEDSRDCERVQPLLEELRFRAGQLQVVNLESEVPVLMELVREAKCRDEIDAFPVLAVLIQLECRCRRPIDAPVERLEDSLLVILKLLLSDKPLTKLTEPQKKAVATVARAIEGTAGHSSGAQSGFELNYPPEVVRVICHEKATGRKFERAVTDGRVLVLAPADTEMAFRAEDAMGNQIDYAVLRSNY